MLIVCFGIIVSVLFVLIQVMWCMVGVVSLIILVWILIFEDYGFVVIVLLFFNFIDVILSIGGDSYLLSWEELSDDLVYINWIFNFILKGSLVVLFVFFSYFIV